MDFEGLVDRAGIERELRDEEAAQARDHGRLDALYNEAEALQQAMTTREANIHTLRNELKDLTKNRASAAAADREGGGGDDDGEGGEGAVAAAPRKEKKTWDGAFEWDEAVDALLRDTFQLSSFRPMQREVINATLSGEVRLSARASLARHTHPPPRPAQRSSRRGLVVGLRAGLQLTRAGNSSLVTRSRCGTVATSRS